MTQVTCRSKNRNEEGGALLGKVASLPAELGATSCLCGVHLLLIPPGAALGGMPSRERASSPLGLVVTAAPGPWPGWLWPGRRRSEVWEASTGPTAAPSSCGGGGRGWSSLSGAGAWPHGGEGKRWGCRRSQQWLRHDETMEKQMGKSSVPISSKK